MVQTATIHVLDEDKFRRRVKDLHIDSNTHRSSIFGMSKHFVVDLFPTLHGGFVMIDIDMILGADICYNLPLVVKPNRRRAEEPWLAMPVHDGWRGIGFPAMICSCFVIYKDADLLRKVGWTSKLITDIPVEEREKLQFGDQSLMFAIKERNGGRLVRPCALFSWSGMRACARVLM